MTDRDRMRELGRLGGQAKAAKVRAKRGERPQPFAGTILDAMAAVGMTGPSWAAWRAFWAAVFALPMDDDMRQVFTACTGRAEPPSRPAHEAWEIIGRRGGKSRNAALAAVYLATRRDYSAVLAPGERAIVAVVAADRKQAGQVLGFIKGMLRTPTFAPFIGRVLKEAIELRVGVTIEVHSASYRTTRGYTVVGLVADELAFWPQDESATPDREILDALRPAMATVEGALLLGLSTPYSRRGELFRAWERHYGKDGDVLVWRAPSRTMNPALDAGVVARAYEDDAVVAGAEYGAEWRRDVESFIEPEAVTAATVPGRLELPPVQGVRYHAFLDPSGGSQDSMTLAVAHRQGESAVLDCVRERRAPFSPDAVTGEFAALLWSYGLSRASSDRYAGAWVAERFAAHGIKVEPSEKPKSDLYTELLPIINAARCELLDLPRLRAQLLGLERRTARSGRDSVDHAPGAHDDMVNAAAGALVAAAGVLKRRPQINFSFGAGVFCLEDGKWVKTGSRPAAPRSRAEWDAQQAQRAHQEVERARKRLKAEAARDAELAKLDGPGLTAKPLVGSGATDATRKALGSE